MRTRQHPQPIPHPLLPALRWPALLASAMIGLFMLPILLNTLFKGLNLSWEQVFPAGDLAPLFTSPVDYWGSDITRWAQEYALDPNLLATVMQIESCGHPYVVSRAGAQGLFQVMPFHFAPGESYLDPETNAQRGARFLRVCGDYTNHDPGMMLACYNGGPSVTQRSFHTWPAETKRYYAWGVGIYSDARKQLAQSETLNRWLQAGGAALCQQATTVLGIAW